MNVQYRNTQFAAGNPMNNQTQVEALILIVYRFFLQDLEWKILSTVQIITNSRLR